MFIEQADDIPGGLREVGERLERAENLPVNSSRARENLRARMKKTKLYATT